MMHIDLSFASVFFYLPGNVKQLLNPILFFLLTKMSHFLAFVERTKSVAAFCPSYQTAPFESLDFAKVYGKIDGVTLVNLCIVFDG